MKIKITESDIKELVKEAINSIISNEPDMFFLVDESDGAIIGNYTDKEEAINDAKENANPLRRYLVVDRDENVYYDTNPGISGKI